MLNKELSQFDRARHREVSTHATITLCKKIAGRTSPRLCILLPKRGVKPLTLAVGSVNYVLLKVFAKRVKIVIEIQKNKINGGGNFYEFLYNLILPIVQPNIPGVAEGIAGLLGSLLF